MFLDKTSWILLLYILRNKNCGRAKYTVMLTFEDCGRPIAHVDSGRFKNQIISLISEPDDSKTCLSVPEIALKDGKIQPIMNTGERQVCYIAGPSGSGKSHYAANLIKTFKKVFPKKDVFLFSRTSYKDDPAYAKLKPIQIEIDNSLIEDPIDITELQGGCLIIFDDCNTIPDEDLKKAVMKLMEDIMEVGRKLGIYIIITNHLVVPNERKFSRTVLNEMQSLTFYPKSGSAHQIETCLKKYFGLATKMIRKIMDLNSRWVTIHKNYPQFILHEHGALVL